MTFDWWEVALAAVYGATTAGSAAYVIWSRRTISTQRQALDRAALALLKVRQGVASVRAEASDRSGTRSDGIGVRVRTIVATTPQGKLSAAEYRREVARRYLAIRPKTSYRELMAVVDEAIIARDAGEQDP